MKTEWYEVNMDGVRMTEIAAVQKASALGKDSEEMVWVHGNCEYSEDDKTPLQCRTYFWAHRGYSSTAINIDGNKTISRADPLAQWWYR